METAKKHIILGAGGAISISLANELIKKNEKVKLVSRKGFGLKGAESVKADILDYKNLVDILKTGDIVYLTAGLKYDKKVWQELWRPIMQNTINACKETNNKLIFFDNVYMYGKVDGKMTEDLSYNPVSIKGEIRAKISLMLEDEYKKGNITALIARAADLYGPFGDEKAVLNFMVVKNLISGKKAQWLGDLNKIHSFTYIPDCGKALVKLAGDEKAFNQIWHLPTFNPALTGNEIIETTAKLLNIKPKIQNLKPGMVKFAGFFNTTIKEVYEMMYQNIYDYYFDSSKFDNYFNDKPISYLDGLKETINYIKSQMLIKN